MGLICIGMGLFNKKFTLLGWTTMLIWGTGEKAAHPKMDCWNVLRCAGVSTRLYRSYRQISMSEIA